MKDRHRPWGRSAVKSLVLSLDVIYKVASTFIRYLEFCCLCLLWSVCCCVSTCNTLFNYCGTHIPQWCYLWNSSPTLPGVNYSYTVHHWSIRVIKCFPTPFSMASSHRNVHWYSRHPCVSKTSGINHPSLHSQGSRFFPIKMEGHAA